jgi:hypothetical protein
MGHNPDGTPHYAPLRDGPPGDNLGDQLKPWARAVRDVPDIGALGYSYELSPSQPMIMAEATPTRKYKPFSQNNMARPSLSSFQTSKPAFSSFTQAPSLSAPSDPLNGFATIVSNIFGNQSFGAALGNSVSGIAQLPS